MYMAKPLYRRVTLRLPEEEAKRVDGILKAHNKGKRAKDRMSMNEWLVAGSSGTRAVGEHIPIGVLVDLDGNRMPPPPYFPAVIGFDEEEAW